MDPKEFPVSDAARPAGPDTDRRLIRLEEKLAYQEETISQLDEVVRDLSTKVRRLKEQLDDLREMATPLDLNRTAEDDIPPHSARREV